MQVNIFYNCHQCKMVTVAGYQCRRSANHGSMCSWHYNKKNMKSSELEDFLTFLILFCCFGPFYLIYLIFQK